MEEATEQKQQTKIHPLMNTTLSLTTSFSLINYLTFTFPDYPHM